MSKIPPEDYATEDLLISSLDNGTIGWFWLGRIFFRTKYGRFGLGSGTTKPGDVVVVLLGSSVPYIFRKTILGLHLFIGDWNYLSQAPRLGTVTDWSLIMFTG